VPVLDVHTFIGGVPYRGVPHPEPAILARVLAREGVDVAWVGHLPSAFAEDAAEGNDELHEALLPHHHALKAAPCIHPGRAKWERALARELDRGAAAIRAYPGKWKMTADDPDMRALAAACGEARIPLLLTLRLERAPMLTAAAIENVVCASPSARVIVTAASRAFIESVVKRFDAVERRRLWWDLSSIAGPPADDLAYCFRTLGSDRFFYGSGWPLRLTQTPRANLELLPDDVREAPLALAVDVHER
jgi:hypothetical protein